MRALNAIPSVASYGTLISSPGDEPRERSSSMQVPVTDSHFHTESERNAVKNQRGRSYTDDLNNHSRRRPKRKADYIDVLMRVGGAEDEDEEEEDEEEEETGEMEKITPHPPRDRRHGKHTTNRQAFFTMIKAIVGSGVLFLPRAFADGGALFSTVAEICIALLTGLCVYLVIQARGSSHLTFAEMGELAAGPVGRLAVQAALISFQLGLVVSYFIFVADTVQSLVRDITRCRTDLDPTLLIYAHALLQIPIACLRNIRSLALIAEVADICIVGGILLVLAVCVKVIYTEGPSHNISLVRPYTSLLFVGTSVVSFEGVALMIPIKESMKHPEAFNNVLLTAISVVCVLYTTVGLLGVLAFGEGVEQNVLLSVGAHGMLGHAVSTLYSVAIICSLPLQAFPAYRVLEIALGIPSGKHFPTAKWTKNFLRASILMALAGLAVSTRQSLHYIVAIIGGVAGVPLGFILPALIHHRVCGTQPIIDTLIIYFGIAMTILVTGIAMKEWIFSVPPPPQPCVPY